MLLVIEEFPSSMPKLPRSDFVGVFLIFANAAWASFLETPFPMLSKLSPPFPEDAMALLFESAREFFEVAALLLLPVLG